ncbi:CPBP family intramembrane glutamic endopeptidase [Pseudoalteromonas sp. SWYJZ19]|uniref:CPBP family intramembrane glutamic endopeptidase n=1 Tax=Pseudoalteromonas sp. SWYJZ19 TaxID=2792068 RepID=UPI0018CE652E|nr:CPBP family intramembrane glutamic endopeptidase [Pseudoalteromonas sp. SWYJZ19]MBH0052494.1 CPBP family intramembrane metalloprotease [Pseudoalteromonas sp. SWYJZ19]
MGSENQVKSSEVSSNARLDKYTIAALVIGLIAYPVLYSTDFFSSLLFPFLPDEFISSLHNDNKRTEWWYFIFSNLLFHWIPFLFIRHALIKNNETWSSIGVDWSWFLKHKSWFVGLFTILIISAFVIPEIYYANELPTKSQAGFIGPISTLERLIAVVVLAFTAAITEEIIFRGFALTRLKRIIPNPWFILPIIAISFVFIHGEIRSLGLTLNYLIFSLIFGGVFIVNKFKRLEILILIHFLINASLVFVY